MTRNVVRCFLFGICAVIGSWPATAAAATTAGVYAILDAVEFEPSDAMPDRIRLTGTFVVPRALSSGQHLAPVRGNLYFSLNPDEPEASLRDWQALAEAAGTGAVVGFAEYWRRIDDDRSRVPSPVGTRNATSSVNVALTVEVHDDSEPEVPAAYPTPNRRGVITSFEREEDLCPRFGQSMSAIIAELRAAHAPGESYDALPVCESR